MTAENEVSLVRCGTTAGPIALRLHREWAPHGYDRAVELFEAGFYDGSHFFRVVPDFLVQFGITYSTSEELKQLANTPIPDDPQFKPPVPFVPGVISYAGSGDNSRTSQLFISYKRNKGLGQQKWETPIGIVVEGLDNAKKFYSYGDMPPWGKGPVQGKIHSGRSYIEDNFPLTDRFHECLVVRDIIPDDTTPTTDDEIDKEKDDEEDEKENTNADAFAEGLGNDEPALAKLTEPTMPESGDTDRHMVGDASHSSASFVAAFGVLVLVAICVFALSGKMFRNKARNRKTS